MANFTVFYYTHARFEAVTAALSSAIALRPQYRLFTASSIAEMKSSPLFGHIDIIVLLFLTPPEALREVLLHNDVKWIHCLSAGVNQYMIPEVMSSKAVFTNAKGVYSEELADWTMGAVLHFVKQVKRLQENKKTKTWDVFYMDVLYGKTMLILGYGNIGAAVAKRAKHGFQMRVIGLKQVPAPSPHADEVLSVSSLHSLLPQADVLVMALPNTPDTVDIINEAELALMKPTAIIVNVGRGSQLNEEALIRHLQDGSLGGAALDVCKKEPLPADSLLWECPNVVISPHTACVNDTTEVDTVAYFVESLEAFYEGRIEERENVVDRTKGY